MMTDAPDGVRRVTVAEAAALLGVSVDTIKRRIRSGGLQGIRTARGRVLVAVPDYEAAPQAVPAAPHDPVDAPQGVGQVQGSDVEHGALVERVAAITAERDWLRERVERAESEREQLRILLSNAQQSLVRALHAAPQGAEVPPEPQPVPDPFPVPNPPTPNAEPSRWRRWWLALAGANVAR